MASHPHCRHQQTHHQSSTCYSCCCSCSSPNQPHSLSQPQISPTDPLVQAIATQLLHQQQSQQQIFTHYLNQPHYHHQQQKNHHQHPKKYHRRHHHAEEDEEDEQVQTQLVTSLLRRIKTLESSLHTLSHSPPPSSLRDLAARTIQTHFRAYLVRRSQTLRHLKHLAMIKSSFTSLKSSVSTKPHFSSEAISQKAMDLLLKLDDIQGGDPMIREGKRAISRELVQFLEYLDGVSIRREQLRSKTMKKVRFARAAEESRAYKSTTNENVTSFHEQGAACDDQAEVMEDLCKKIENIEGFTRVYEEEGQSESDGTSSSSTLSNGERSPTNNLKNGGNSGSNSHFQGKNERCMFSAPLPVQMEPTRDDDDGGMRREKTVRVAR